KFPNNATYLDTHAWVLFQLKEYEEAIKFMKKALDHQSEPSGVMLEHYGDILFKLGNKKGALEYWKEAQLLDDVSEFLPKKIKDQQYYESTIFTCLFPFRNFCLKLFKESGALFL